MKKILLATALLTVLFTMIVLADWPYPTETVPQTQTVLNNYFAQSNSPSATNFAELIDTMFYYVNVIASNAAVAQAAAQSFTNSGFLQSVQFYASVSFRTSDNFDSFRHIGTSLTHAQNVSSVTFSNASSPNVNIWIACNNPPPGNVIILAGNPAGSGSASGLTTNFFSPPVFTIVNGTNLVIQGKYLGYSQSGSSISSGFGVTVATNFFILGLE